MTTYHNMNPQDQPFDFMLDENKRIVFSCNFLPTAVAPVINLEREVAKLINTAGLGTLNTDMFIGRTRTLPEDGDEAFVQILHTGGLPPGYIHNNDEPNLEHPSFQILVRSKDFEAARTRAWAIWHVLDRVRHEIVVA